jgi:hypothetical protein
MDSIGGFAYLTNIFVYANLSADPVIRPVGAGFLLKCSGLFGFDWKTPREYPPLP